jgi:hypothetical protein
MRLNLLWNFRVGLLLAVAFTALPVGPTAARADSLNLSPVDPDIEPNTLSVTYDATTHILSAVDEFPGMTDYSFMPDSATSDYVPDGIFILSAQFSPSGVFQTAGSTISISGDLFDASNNPLGSGPLIVGNLTDFSYTNASGGPQLQFTFAATGGLLLTKYGFGTSGGIILDDAATTPTPLSFSATYNGDAGEFYGDVFPHSTPLPPAAVPGILLVGGLIVVRQWRARKAPFNTL